MIKSRKVLERRVTDIVFGATGELCNHDNSYCYTLHQASKFMPRLKVLLIDDLKHDVFTIDNLTSFQRLESIVSEIWCARKI